MHCWLKIPAVVYVRQWNARLELRPEWSGAGVTLVYVVRDEYEPEVTFLGKLLGPGETFVDAGANCGVYTVAAAHFVGPKGVVLAFEPGENSLAMLRNNVALNRFEQVRIFPLALSENCGRARLYAHSHGASSFTLGRTEEDEQLSSVIETVTLDAILARENVREVDVIKMDVEGAEELILRGAPELFERCHPKIIFEINPDAIRRLQLSEQGAWNFLATRGYRFFSMQNDGTLASIETRPESANVIALHPKVHSLPQAERGTY
ncbi:MAG: FkbM family methyltransferase [Chthoniobacter sp.]|uniref:FkbM family methyltransferase n=1 Tax=Chthoniobacter sp. TaxID=2510640 RepID=UPI0032A7016D